MTEMNDIIALRWNGTRWTPIGRVVQPDDGHKKVVLYRKLRNWWPEKVPVTSHRGIPLYEIESTRQGFADWAIVSATGIMDRFETEGEAIVAHVASTTPDTWVEWCEDPGPL